jgi:hypothetical protein
MSFAVLKLNNAKSARKPSIVPQATDKASFQGIATSAKTKVN